MTTRRGSIGAAVLAGGRARRYGGAAKGMLDLGGGRTILQRLLDELDAAGVSEVILCAGAAAGYEALARPIVPDVHDDAGPLGGIEAALGYYAGQTDATLVLPCDLPGITAAEIDTLLGAFRRAAARVVVAETGDSFWHPLCAVVHNDILPEVTASIEHGERGVGWLWRKLGALPVRFDDEWALFNVNTPEDLARWREGSGH